MNELIPNGVCAVEYITFTAPNLPDALRKLAEYLEAHPAMAISHRYAGPLNVDYDVADETYSVSCFGDVIE